MVFSCRMCVGWLVDRWMDGWIGSERGKDREGGIYTYVRMQRVQSEASPHTVAIGFLSEFFGSWNAGVGSACSDEVCPQSTSCTDAWISL